MNIYCFLKNTSTQSVDFLGLSDCYDSLSKALQAACEENGPLSRNPPKGDGKERGGVIAKCKPVNGKDCFKFSVTIGTEGQMTAKQIHDSRKQCDECKPVATWHSHPRTESNDPETRKMDDGPGGRNAANGGFSIPDVDFNRNVQKKDNGFGRMKGGLCGSDGTVRVHNPDKVTNASRGGGGYDAKKNDKNVHNPRIDKNDGELFAPGQVIGNWAK